MHSLLFLEFIGTSELLVVLVVALIIFGPRKLPELGRSLGQAMHQLRGATEDFKRTWETEARLDTARGAALAPAADADLADAAAPQGLAPGDASLEASAFEETQAPQHEAPAANGLAFAGPEASFGEA
jgi:TatA/E family protein of Tat protein translocase